jgi:hypothetical protein
VQTAHTFTKMHSQLDYEGKFASILQDVINPSGLVDITLQYLFFKIQDSYITVEFLKKIIEGDRIQSGQRIPGYLVPGIPRGILTWFSFRNVTLGCGCASASSSASSSDDRVFHHCDFFLSNNYHNVCWSCRNTFMISSFHDFLKRNSNLKKKPNFNSTKFTSSFCIECTIPRLFNYCHACQQFVEKDNGQHIAFHQAQDQFKSNKRKQCDDDLKLAKSLQEHEDEHFASKLQLHGDEPIKKKPRPIIPTYPTLPPDKEDEKDADYQDCLTEIYDMLLEDPKELTLSDLNTECTKPTELSWEEL